MNWIEEIRKLAKFPFGRGALEKAAGHGEKQQAKDKQKQAESAGLDLRRLAEENARWQAEQRKLKEKGKAATTPEYPQKGGYDWRTGHGRRYAGELK